MFHSCVKVPEGKIVSRLISSVAERRLAADCFNAVPCYHRDIRTLPRTRFFSAKIFGHLLATKPQTKLAISVYIYI